MEENRFWLRMWSLTASVLISGMASCSYFEHEKKDKWEKAVANGADPLVVSCALGVGGSGSSHADAVMCNTVAQRNGRP